VRDAVFAAILGGGGDHPRRLLRGVAVGIDQARSDAVASYAVAAAHNAAETERVAVAALMHDSVLAALIAAERAHTPREEALAAAMAREALTRLANAEQDAGEGPTSRSPWRRLRPPFAGWWPISMRTRLSPPTSPRPPAVPGRVARAVVLAATQAVSNAIVHAHGEGLRVALRADAAPARAGRRSRSRLRSGEHPR
jgi:signal transduction histidine kinase